MSAERVDHKSLEPSRMDPVEAYSRPTGSERSIKAQQPFLTILVHDSWPQLRLLLRDKTKDQKPGCSNKSLINFQTNDSTRIQNGERVVNKISSTGNIFM